MHITIDRVLEVINKETKAPPLLPGFLESIMSLPHGYTVLVKGEAGTGKTTLAMAICLEFKDVANVLYVSTRASLADLAKQYPGFLDIIGPSRVRGASAVTDRDPGDGDARAVRGFPVGIEETVPFYNLEQHVKDVKGDDKPFILVLDPADRIVDDFTRKTPKKDPMDVYDMLVALARVYDLKLFIISETRDRVKEDYLVDGIISLSLDTGTGLRYLRVHKLRNIALQHQVMLYTLHGGQFRILEPITPKISMMPVNLQVRVIENILVANPEIADFFTSMLSARTICLDFDSHSNNFACLAHIIFIVVALRNGLNIFHVIPPDVDASLLLDGLVERFGFELVERHVRIAFLPSKKVTGPYRDIMIPSNSDDIIEEFKNATIDFENLANEPGNKGTLLILPLDHVFQHYNGDTIMGLFKFLQDESRLTGNSYFLGTNLAFNHDDQKHLKFVDSFLGRVLHSIRVACEEGSMVASWLHVHWPAFSFALFGEDIETAPERVRFEIMKIA